MQRPEPSRERRPASAGPEDRIAAILLTLLLAVTLFAMTRGSSPADTAPAGARVGVTQQLGGGGPIPSVCPTRTLPAQQPIMIEDYVCHQCR